MTKKYINTRPAAGKFFIPASDVLSASHSVSTDETRHYLRGVLVQSDCMVSTNGHTLIKIDAQESAWVGEGCNTQDSGFILACDVREKAFKAKSAGELWILGDVETGILEFLDSGDCDPYDEKNMRRVGVCEFSRIDGTFPDWTRIMPGTPKNVPTSIAFNPTYIADMEKAARVLTGERPGHECLRVDLMDSGAPFKVTCRDPRFTGIIMPMRAQWEH